MTSSAEQLAIFDWFKAGKGNLVVKARAGVGKTFTVKEGFSYAPQSEKRIIYLVFNKKNQKEAEEKITDPRVEVRTFHGLGYKFILQNWPGVKPADEVEADRLDSLFDLRDAFEDRGLILKLVGFAKNCCVNPTYQELEALAEERDIDISECKTDIVACALEVLRLSKERDKQGRISFNDMVWLPVSCGWVRPSYDLVTIDEAQDQSSNNLLMARQAARGRIVVVGDDRQCIYGFRGAHTNSLQMMKLQLKAQVLTLTTTYRCPKLVVAQARTIVPDYQADASAPDGEVKSLPDTSSATPGDAILSRLNAPLMPIALSLLRKNIPAMIEGRDIGKQLLTMVRSMRAKSVPMFMERVQGWLDKQIERLKKIKNNEKKIEQSRDIAETLQAIAEGCKGVGEIESRIENLFSDTNSNSKPAVILSSVHKAKGLEFPRVFILSDTFRKGKGIEEDNIWYVAVTRAMKSLYFVGGGMTGAAASKAEAGVIQVDESANKSTIVVDSPVSQRVVPETLSTYQQGDIIQYGAQEFGCLWCNHSRVAFRKLGGGEVVILSLKSKQTPIARKLTGDELTKFLVKGTDGITTLKV